MHTWILELLLWQFVIGKKKPITYVSTPRSHSPRSPSKRPRLENSDSNGLPGTLTPTKPSLLATEKSPVDPNSSEHIIAINRLQEQLDNLKKQLSLKDQQLLEKEKKVNTLLYSIYTVFMLSYFKMNKVCSKI